MPELPEIKIMSDFINQVCDDKIFEKIYHIQKGEIIKDISDELKIYNFKISSQSYGKELTILLNDNIPIKFFMGMSGNFSFVKTNELKNIKFQRLRFDTTDGYSLVCHGGYLGPKFTFTSFKGVKRGPDITIHFKEMKDNILNNLHKKEFDKPLYEVLLNQQYFGGVGNYIRSTFIYYLDENPFTDSRSIIKKRKDFFQVLNDVIMKSYHLNGGQLRDWKNPLNKDSEEFKDWVFYKKGLSIKDSKNRTFWYDEKWKQN